MEWKISTINEQQQLQWQQQKQQQQKWLHEFYLIFPKAVVGLIWNDFFLFWLCKFFILIILILFLVKTNSETKKYNSNMRWNFNYNWINQQKNQMFKLFHSCSIHSTRSLNHFKLNGLKLTLFPFGHRYSMWV